jgi:ribosome-associated protein
LAAIIGLSLSTSAINKATVTDLNKPSPSSARPVMVREVPIELCQFIKFGGLSESGGAAKQLIAEGGVLLNGAVETRKRKQLAAGDQVTVAGRTIVVQLA